MRKPRWWRRSLVVLAIAVGAFMALPVAHAQQVFAPGAVVALEGTPHLWIADSQGVLHWGGDTRALAGRHINWGSRTEVSLERLRALPKGDPWLSTGLLKQGDPIYLVKWESDWTLPRLLHIQSIADVEIFGINETNYGNFVLDVATWQARYGIAVASLQRAELPPAVPSMGMAPAAPATPGMAAPTDVPYQSITGYDGGGGVLNLPRGLVRLNLEFGGWGAGPVTVTYRIGTQAPIALINNQRVPFYQELDLNIPHAAPYTFQVDSVRDWRIWVGLEPGLPSVPKPLANCRTNMRWHRTDDGVHRARYDCAGTLLDGTSYSEVNTDKKQWVVWHVDNRFLGVTSTGSEVRTGEPDVAYQILRGFNSRAGQLTLPAGRVTIMIEYGNWSSAPMSVSYQTPSGQHVRLLDSATVPFRTSWTIDVARAGAHTFQVDAQGSWRLWVGVDVGSASSQLMAVEEPVADCSATQDWKLEDGVYRSRYKCPAFILYGVHYPGLATDMGLWVVWMEESDFHSVTFHAR